MSERFRKYDHVERYGHPDVEGFDAGVVHVFPKLDGTNAHVWVDPSLDPAVTRPILQAGSRSRTLSSEADNAGFWAWTRSRELHLLDFILRFGSHCHVYGEWLVPHTLKTYREEAWRKFWIFDVFLHGRGYLPFDEWSPVAEEFGLDYVGPLCTITNPTEEQLQHQVEVNTFLVADGAGVGEGVVCKNFAWTNRHGRQPWAKIVRNEFKERSREKFGVPHKDGGFEVEAAIAEEFVTPSLVAKCRAKIVLELHAERWSCDETEVVFDVNTQRMIEEKERKRLIPRLLQTVYTDLLREELYPAIKKLKDPTINFKRLRAQCIRFTKEYAGDLF